MYEEQNVVQRYLGPNSGGEALRGLLHSYTADHLGKSLLCVTVPCGNNCSSITLERRKLQKKLKILQNLGFEKIFRSVTVQKSSFFFSFLKQVEKHLKVTWMEICA